MQIDDEEDEALNNHVCIFFSHWDYQNEERERKREEKEKTRCEIDEKHNNNAKENHHLSTSLDDSDVFSLSHL